MRLVINTDNVLNVHLKNVLDSYLKIIELLNVQNHLKTTINDENNSASTKGAIVHRKKNTRTMIMITIKIYMHLWHVRLAMTKFLLEILATVRNLPIGF